MTFSPKHRSPFARMATSALLAIAAFGTSIAQDQVPQNVTDALKRADDSIAAIIAIPDGQRTFDNTIGALDLISVTVDNETSMTAFQMFVHPDAKVRDDARAADEAITNWSINLGKREDLYKAVKAFADTKPTLTGEQAKLLMYTMRDYRRAGMDLPTDKRDRLKAIEMELNKLGLEFEKNIAEDNAVVPLFASELKGVPKDVIDRQKKSSDTYLFGLDGPSYGGLMDYCSNGETRQKMWLSYRRRAMGRNVPVLEKLLKLRAEAAQLLGFKNTVDWQIETRMAKNSETVAKFYEELIPIVRKKAEADVAELKALKATHTKKKDVTFYPWDYAFYKNMLREKKYAVDSEKVAEYFPMQSVLDGLFSITQSLYGVEYKEVTAQAASLNLPVWHPDAKLYEVWDKATAKMIGRFYLDLHPRENKYTHAAHWGLRSHRINEDGTKSLPLSALVCNFTKPTAEKPSLMPHDEVETFFHEFGHLLHNMFGKARYGRFSGPAGVARDFVEAPSQMFENWVWDPAVLKTFARHYKTGEPLPDKLLKGMKDARTLGSGIETQGQLYLGMMDQTFHVNPTVEVDTTKVGNEIYEKTTVYKALPHTGYQASFGHLVGYHGAYYGYLWSLVYAQDMFQRFEELGMLSPEAGKYYREKVLSRGDQEDEMAMLRDYLGREPQIEAFYKHLGLDPKGK